MATRLTVFYSWQSDSPSNLNRSFVEKALTEALKRLQSDATLVSALRDATVELDKDTQGVAGSPPIAETILRKIEACAAFVADLSFVGQSKPGFANASGKPRQFPNPNVLMEYGYALRCHSNARMIGVMNTAYGKPDAESLPFDLRHLRWPICYHLETVSAPDKSDRFEALASALVSALRLILSEQPTNQTLAFTPARSTSNPAVFFDSPEDLIGDRSDTFAVPEGGKAYLRLYPVIAVPPINLELEARNLVTAGNLQPLGRVSNWGFDRNRFGAIAYEMPEEGKLYHFTQLFLSREIWGVDARILNADHIAENNRQWGHPGLDRYIATGYIEEHFIKALQNYVAFAQKHLQVRPPLQIEAGLVGVKGYSTAVRNNQILGRALRDTINSQIALESYEEPAWKVLCPFFDQIWANCGIQRTAQDQDVLIKRFRPPESAGNP